MTSYLHLTLHVIKPELCPFTSNCSKPKRQRQLLPEEMLGTPEEVAIFAKWAPAIGLFHRHYSGLDIFGKGEDNGVQE